jgi:Fur family ferric uptake transcriptional regulator
MNKKAQVALLNQFKIKKTDQRLLIISSLANASAPITAEALWQSLDQKIDLATIYRNVQLLAEKGVIYQTSFRDNKIYYELQQSHHHHITCTSCGFREETNICVAVDMVRDKSSFKKIDQHTLEFFGHCSSCQ